MSTKLPAETHRREKKMSSIRLVTADFSVSPQIALSDLTVAANQGVKRVICNRPDDEDAGQINSTEVRAAAEALGLTYAHIPVIGGPTPDQVEEMHTAIAEAGGPVLAYCRSGTRSIVTWAIGQMVSGEREASELIALGTAAGYDLSSVLRR
jgi:uncharacterized protein (TIGR01244 family)